MLVQDQHVMKRTSCFLFVFSKEAAGAVICLIFVRLFAFR